MVTAGHDTVAVRAPAGKVARGLIERSGQPIAAPSANRSNRISPTRAEHVLADLDGRIDLIIDSGPTAIGLESTVLDLTTRAPAAAPPGTDLERGAGSSAGGRSVVDDVTAGESGDRPSSPGQMPVHYAPRTPAFRVDSLEELGRHRSSREHRAWSSIGEHAPVSLSGSPRQFALESPESGLATALRRLAPVRLARRATRSSWSCRPTSPSGRPFATGCCARLVRLPMSCE